MSAGKYPPASPHDPIQELFPGVFWVHGSVRVGPGMQMNRNMLIVRRGDQLTLINPVRLSTSELSKLDQLGNVKNIVRLGDFHGLDDPFYVDRYAEAFWCQRGQATYKLPEATIFVEAGPVTPVENS